MDPLQFFLPGHADWSSWFSFIIASCLVPFIYNLVSNHLSGAIQRIQQEISDRLNRFEEVLVHNDHRNSLFWYVSVFLNAKAEKASASKNARIELPMDDVVVFGLEKGQRVRDAFQGIEVEWEFCAREQEQDRGEKSFFMLRIRREHRHLQRPYLLHIAKTVIAMEQQKKERCLYTCKDFCDPYWEPYVFKHPSTFESLAMEPAVKAKILNDLKEFANSREYYESVGKPWKRGYLLYGPPGTGKSSLIAAIANHLSYDIYDLDLCGVRSNGDLRQLLLQTSNKSVIVIEDIDCCFSTSLQSRAAKPKKKKRSATGGDSSPPEGITLSGMLNFCDGLWSGSGNERVFIFTTNHVENLDPALLRKGRMDLHICMSYCKFEALKTLVKNYLAISEHELLGAIEKLLDRAEATPADIAEVLLSSRRDPTAALENLIGLLQQKISEAEQRSAGAATDKSPIAAAAEADDVASNSETMNGFVEVLEQAVEEEDDDDGEDESDGEESDDSFSRRRGRGGRRRRGRGRGGRGLNYETDEESD